MVQFWVEEEAGIILMVWFTFSVCEMEKSLRLPMSPFIEYLWVKEMSEKPDKKKFLCRVLEAGSHHAWGF